MTKETSCRKGCDTRMLIRLVSMICAIPSLPSQRTSGLNDPPTERVMYPPPPAGHTPLETNSDGDIDA